MSRRKLLAVGEDVLLPLTADEVARCGGTNPADAWWLELIGMSDSVSLVARLAWKAEVARRRHVTRPAFANGEQERERRVSGMRRKLVRVDNGWALPLSAEQLTALGVTTENMAVLVRTEDGNPPRLIIRRAPTFEEAAQGTLMEHHDVLVTLASFPAQTDRES